MSPKSKSYAYAGAGAVLVTGAAIAVWSGVNTAQLIACLLVLGVAALLFQAAKRAEQQSINDDGDAFLEKLRRETPPE